MNDRTEIEAKFFVDRLVDIREKVIDHGGRVLVPRGLERNFRFDDPKGELTASHQVLRLRVDHRATLTYKRSQSPEVRNEIGFEIDDFQAAKAFLEALGYQVFFIYEKYRETFILGRVRVMLDELPYGCFVEIEGTTLTDVKDMAKTLGYSWEHRTRSTYHGFFESICKQYHLNFRDATFENFASLPNAKFDILTVVKAESNLDD
jgi:adenylate cyclase class 2